MQAACQPDLSIHNRLPNPRQHHANAAASAAAGGLRNPPPQDPPSHQPPLSSQQSLPRSHSPPTLAHHSICPPHSTPPSHTRSPRPLSGQALPPAWSGHRAGAVTWACAGTSRSSSGGGPPQAQLQPPTLAPPRSAARVLFLHGFLGSARDWAPIAAALSTTHLCVCPGPAGAWGQQPAGRARCVAGEGGCPGGGWGELRLALLPG